MVFIYRLREIRKFFDKEKDRNYKETDIDLAGFRLSCNDFLKYKKMNPGEVRRYLQPPAGYKRDFSYDLQLGIISEKWDNIRSKLIEDNNIMLNDAKSIKADLQKLLANMEISVYKEKYDIPLSLILRLKYLGLLVKNNVDFLERIIELDRFSMTGGDKFIDFNQNYEYYNKEKFYTEFD